MRYKAVFVDIDNTLLSFENKRIRCLNFLRSAWFDILIISDEYSIRLFFILTIKKPLSKLIVKLIHTH